MLSRQEVDIIEKYEFEEERRERIEEAFKLIERFLKNDSDKKILKRLQKKVVV